MGVYCRIVNNCAIMIYLFITILITIALWNAYVILWGTIKENRKQYSKIWHALGLLLRIEVWGAIPLYLFLNGWEWKPLIEYTAVFISVGGVMYDFIINLIRYLTVGKPSLWYVDNKGFNAFFLKFLSPRWYWILRILLAIIIIII